MADISQSLHARHMAGIIAGAVLVLWPSTRCSQNARTEIGGSSDLEGVADGDTSIMCLFQHRDADAFDRRGGYGDMHPKTNYGHFNSAGAVPGIFEFVTNRGCSFCPVIAATRMSA